VALCERPVSYTIRNRSGSHATNGLQHEMSSFARTTDADCHMNNYVIVKLSWPHNPSNKNWRNYSAINNRYAQADN